MSRQRTDETIASLNRKLVALSIKDRRPKTEAYFASFVNQTDVDNWNAFMQRSNEYHSVGDGGEADRLKSYMGDLKKQYERCVRGQEPPSGAASWEGYFTECEKLAEAVLAKNSEILKLRQKALLSAEAVRAVERGLFSRTSWLSHIDQVIGHAKATGDIHDILMDINSYQVLWKAENAKYRADSAGYKFTKFTHETRMDQLAAEIGKPMIHVSQKQREAEMVGRNKVEMAKREQKRAEHTRAVNEKLAKQAREQERLEDEFLAQQTEEERFANMDALDRFLYNKRRRQNTG